MATQLSNAEIQRMISTVLEYDTYDFFDDLLLRFYTFRHPLATNAAAEAVVRIDLGDYHIYFHEGTRTQLYPLLFQYLQERGADLNAPDSQGETPLHYSCRNHRYSSIQWVLSRHGHLVQVDARNKHGMTPLHVACREGQFDLVKLLLGQRGGANLFAVDNQERDCVYWAGWRRYHPTYLVRCLRNTKALIQLIDASSSPTTTTTTAAAAAATPATDAARADADGRLMASLCWKDDLFVHVTVPATGETLFQTLCNRVSINHVMHHGYNMSAIIALVKREADLKEKESDAIQEFNDENEDNPVFDPAIGERPKKKKKTNPRPYWHAALLPWLRQFKE